ncbi:MAG: glycoside hydrolase family 1 protein [Brevinematales bacterium]|nr:glycoside hydrolase family 1 protein [Brevinematales bacterium]
MRYKPFDLPKGFLLGSATASLQIEGGDTNNSWYRWCEKGKIKDGSHCIVADDHWNRIGEDIGLMKKMHHQVYRMSIEWSRIQPDMEEFDKDAMEHYRNEIIALRKAKIEPLVTLHHFSNPLWFEDMGGWLHPDAPYLFNYYTKYMVQHLGDLVTDWVTINEPNVYLLFSYLQGIWPPGEKKLGSYLRGAVNMIAAHTLAYRTIHEMRKLMMYDDGETRVGAAYHTRVHEPASERKGDKRMAGIVDRLFEKIFVVGMTEGKLIFPLRGDLPYDPGRFSDFMGINYYTRGFVKFVWNPAKMFMEILDNSDCEKNDLGGEIYPEGIYRVCEKYYKMYPMPIFITENGTCDAEDAFRADYIYSHLAQVKRAIDDGIDIRRYYHWSTLDNFEWLEGLSARFGLAEVDYTRNRRRTLRESGKFYGEICKRKSVTQGMIDKFLKKKKRG